MQCDVRDALVVLKAATAQAQAEATKEAQRVGIAHAKDQWGREGLQRSEAELQPQAVESAQAMLGKSASVGEAARSIRAKRFTASRMIGRR